jgi:hypothetical protein
MTIRDSGFAVRDSWFAVRDSRLEDSGRGGRGRSASEGARGGGGGGGGSGGGGGCGSGSGSVVESEGGRHRQTHPVAEDMCQGYRLPHFCDESMLQLTRRRSGSDGVLLNLECAKRIFAPCGLAHLPEGPSPGNLFDPSRVSFSDSGLRTPDQAGALPLPRLRRVAHRPPPTALRRPHPHRQPFGEGVRKWLLSR